MDITSFELLADDIRANENFEFIFAADFPNCYERRDIERLYRIANAGMPAVHSPTEVEFTIVDRRIHGSQWSKTLTAVGELVLAPAKYKTIDRGNELQNKCDSTLDRGR